MRKTSNFLTEFKNFAVKGNMMDLAIGVIIGAAFGKIIDSLVKDVIMPIISFLVGGKVDFSNMFVVLSAPDGLNLNQPRDALAAAGANVLAYGNFITILINFILLAFVVFVMMKLVGKARTALEAPAEPATPAAPPADPADIALLKEIRDLLKK